MKAYAQAQRLFLAIVFGCGLFITLLVQLNARALAAPAGQLDVCATCPYTTIQSAVNAATAGDTIRVAEGTYQDVVTASNALTSTVLITKDLTLLGGFSSDFGSRDPLIYTTTVDGQDVAKGFQIFNASAHVEGFNIVNTSMQAILVRNVDGESPVRAILQNNLIHDGRDAGIVFYRAEGAVVASLIEAHSSGIVIAESVVDVVGNTITRNNGKGVYVVDSAVTISENEVVENSSGGGAGISLEASTRFTVTNNVILNNLSTLYSGGGIAVYEQAYGIIAGNVISGNEADHGGGIGTYASGNLTIVGNTLAGNSAGNGGGGLHINPDDFSFGRTSALTITGNTIEGNAAMRGAGLDIMGVNGDVTISENSIQMNLISTGAPDYEAGGIHIWDIGGEIKVVNNLLANNDNRNLKAVNFPRLWVVNNTIAGSNDGVDIFSWPSPRSEPTIATVTNNIIVNQLGCGLSMFNEVTLYADYNLYHGNDTAICAETAEAPTANLFADPQFVDAASGNYHLQSGSPARDSGFQGTGVPTMDLEGTVRPQGWGVDMGAYEAPWRSLYLPLITR